PADIHAVYPERLNLSAKVTCFVDHLRNWLGQHADGPSPGSSNW
ncbi:MAG: LysR family transcriptional regulator, partial [Rhodocyclaceae bacterium]|nr:LysR family transcriptional regulator [Rhodocyclaceae bacterium]MBL8483268.1 LysR family transcriptional regulator [Rhodocyclaceae bacterium]